MIGWKWYNMYNTVWYCHQAPWTDTGEIHVISLLLGFFWFSFSFFDIAHKLDIFHSIYIYTPYSLYYPKTLETVSEFEKAKPDSNWWTVQENRM